MIGAAMGLAARGAIPFPSTFAAFLTRADDFIRMARDQQRQRQAGRLARRRLDWRGRPVADGARGLRDDVGAAEHHRAVSVPTRSAPRSSSPRWPRHHGSDVHADVATEDTGDLRRHRAFPIGGLKVLRTSGADVATVVGAGVTLFEALKAHDVLAAEGIHIRVIDLYSMQPIDAAALIAAGRKRAG